MCEYESAQTGELMPDEAPILGSTQRTTTQWRRSGLLGLVGVVGVLAYSQWPQRPSLHDHVASVRDSILAFSRHLQDDEANPLAAHIEFSIEDAEEETEWPMMVEVHGGVSDPVPETPRIVITFNAQEGKATDLKQTLQDVVDGAIEFVSMMEGEDAAAEYKKNITVSADDDTADITWNMPTPDDYSKISSTSAHVEKARLTFFLKFARSMEEIFDHKEDAVLTVLGGAKIGARTPLLKKLLRAAEEAKADVPEEERAKSEEFLKKLEVIASLESTTTLKYRKNVLAGFSEATLAQAIEMFQNENTMIPASMLTPLQTLHESADGLKSVVITAQDELTLTFTEFKISKFFKEVLAGMKPPQMA